MGVGMRAKDVAVTLTEAVDALHDAHVGVELERAKQAGVAEGGTLVVELFFKLGRREGAGEGAGGV
jgi:hypothetical protein